MRFAFWKRFKKPKVKDGLVFAFSHGGYDYYQYPEHLGMPLFRLSKLSEYNIWISRGLTKKNLLDLMDTADKLLFEGLSTGKNAAKLGAIITEIRDRENKAVPVEVWYNYLACSYIRDDEKEDKFNEQIQQEKASVFKAASNEANSFFFLLPELKALTTHSNILPIAWQSICRESMLQQGRLKEVISLLKPEKK